MHCCSDRYELEILSCGDEDNGQWKAVGKNEFGVCESSCKLTVEIPMDLKAPEFTVSLLTLLSRLGQQNTHSLTICYSTSNRNFIRQP